MSGLAARNSTLTKVADVFKVVGGGTPSTANPDFWKGPIPWITSADLDDRLGITPRKVISRQAIASSATNLVPAGSVIVATRVGLGKVGIAATDICFSQDCQGLILNPQICDSKFTALQLKVRVQIFKHISRGTTIAGVTKRQLLELPFDLPAIEEQREIVAEIEKQFTRLEAGVAGLRRVQANLKRYRAAVLKAACEGKLVLTETELARQEGRTYETGAQLLERILNERWEKLQGRGQHKKPAAADTTKLPQLPEGWTWASADQISSQITDGEHIQPRYTPEGYPMLSAKHVRNGFVIFTDVPFISEADFQACLKRCAPTRNDILIVCVGATTGRAAIVGDAKPFAVVRSVLLIRTLIQPRFMLAWVQSPWCQTWIQSASGSSAQAHFYINNAKNMCVPLPPLAEQKRIVAEVDRRLSVVEELEAVVNANLQRATRLRQSILQRAFQGKLIGSDHHGLSSEEPRLSSAVHIKHG